MRSDWKGFSIGEKIGKSNNYVQGSLLLMYRDETAIHEVLALESGHELVGGDGEVADAFAGGVVGGVGYGCGGTGDADLAYASCS